MPELLRPPSRVPVLTGTVPAAANTSASAGRRVAARPETLVFRVAMAVVAFALVDDAFVHPEIGTSAGDHLASGLVPLGIAVVLALAYPRLRAGVRAAAALACGALAVTAGVVDGFRHGRPRLLPQASARPRCAWADCASRGAGVGRVSAPGAHQGPSTRALAARSAPT